VLARDRYQCDAMMGLGMEFIAAGELESARIVFAQAAARHPERAAAHAWLGTALLELDDRVAARAAFADALRVEPGHRQAHCGLAILHEREWEGDAARPHWRRAFDDAPVAVSSYRGSAEPVRVLVVTSAVGGNVPLQHVLDDRVFQWATLFAQAYAPGMPLPPHDVVFNTVGDPDQDARALDFVELIATATDAPLLNAPAAVRATGRAAIAERLRDLPGVLTPRIATFPRAVAAAPDGARVLAEHGFGWPILLRAPGFHTGQHFVRVDAAAALGEALATFPGDEVLAIEYLDTRRADGTYRKYRVMFVGGALYPLHLAVSQEWKVHYFSAAMAEYAAYRDEERAFLENMEETLGARAIGALAAIRDALGLDYGGIDFALDDAGSVVAFEANATMVILPPPADERWAYRRAPIQRAIDACRVMIRQGSA
ncbi:MAG TPA: tetratricopeptide repeat protein, partial [Candidatus Limnocylindria bacterium]|nr:tetratricopeptide repeat protein [Candidatus Limnocylindria bacterium]